MFDFALGNGLRVELLEPLHRYRFTYRGQNSFNADVALDLVFAAEDAPHDAGMPGGLDEWGKGHYDQHGRMTGALALDGETIAIDCLSQRDHFWGVRNIVNNPRGKMIWAIGEKSSFHALAVNFRTGRPVAYRVKASDSLGRRLEATGRVRNMLNWQGYSRLMTFWSLISWELDDDTALGEGQDYWPLHHARTFMRRLRRDGS